MPRPPKPRPFKRLPPGELSQLPDSDLAALKTEVRAKMAPGHPPYSASEWSDLCDLEVQLHLEAVNRHFTGTKVKNLKYGK